MPSGGTTSAGQQIVALSDSHETDMLRRHLSFVRNAFAGIPTFVKEIISPEEMQHATDTSDIL